MKRPTTLYRLFGVEDELLYVGVSANIGQRFENHASEKDWWSHVHHITVAHFPDRSDALAAEKMAIRDEGPLYNGKPPRRDRQGLVDMHIRNVPPELERAVKAHCAATGQTVREFAIDAMRSHIERHRAEQVA